MWQLCIIQSYSMTYFDCILPYMFKVSYHWMSINSGAHTYSVDSLDIHVWMKCVWIPLIHPHSNKTKSKPHIAHDQRFKDPFWRGAWDEDLSLFFWKGAWDEAMGHVLISFPVHPQWLCDVYWHSVGWLPNLTIKLVISVDIMDRPVDLVSFDKESCQIKLCC